MSVDLVSDTGTRVCSIPFYKCLRCGELLVSMGVLDMFDDLGNEVGVSKVASGHLFPIKQFEESLLKLSPEDRRFEECYLHSWEIVNLDGRKNWSVQSIN